jgi:hypothetical protein
MTTQQTAKTRKRKARKIQPNSGYSLELYTGHLVESPVTPSHRIEDSDRGNWLEDCYAAVGLC